MARVTRSDVVAAGIVLAAIAAILVVPPAYGFVGWDTYPILAAARVASWRDLCDLFTDGLTASYFPFGFYRPLFSASMALDYGVWGLEPLGFRVTNALLFGGAAAALYRLAGALLGRNAGAGPLVALITVLVFPFHDHLAAGPFSDRSDLLCGLFVVLALLAETRRIAADRPGHAGPACLTLLAQASKETAIVLPALVFVLLLLEDRGPAGMRLRRSLGAAAWHAAAVLLVVAARTLVLGGVAGHATTSVAAAAGRFPAVLGRVVLALLAQRPASAPTTSIDLAAALCFSLACVILGVTCARSRDRDDPTTRAVRAASMGTSMMLASAGVFSLVGWVAPWYLFLPSLGLALVCGAAVEAARTAIRATARRPLAYGLLAGLGAWIAWQASASPFVRRDPTWAQWTRANDAFVSGLQARLEASPAGSVLTVPYPGRILRPYSVQAWADLVFEPGRVRVVTAAAAPDPSVTTVVLVGEARRRE